MKKIVTIGGGGGHSAIVQALKDLPIDLTVLCNTVDDGGGSGILVHQYGVHSPGDFRRVVTSLAQKNADGLNYRFDSGVNQGQTVFNLMLAGLELSTGSVQGAIDTVRDWFGIVPMIAPITEGVPVLHAKTVSGKEIVGQSNVVKHVWSQQDPIEQIFLEPKEIKLSDVARTALHEADYIVVCMGDLYSSIAPFFAIEEVKQMWSKLSAKVIWLPNVAVTPGHVHYKSTSRALKFLQSLSPLFIPDMVVTHAGEISADIKNALQQKGYGVSEQDIVSTEQTQVVAEPLIESQGIVNSHADNIERSPILYNISLLKNIFEKIIV